MNRRGEMGGVRVDGLTNTCCNRNAPDYFFSLGATSEGWKGGVKPEQAELWGSLEEQWFLAGVFRIQSFQ